MPCHACPIAHIPINLMSIRICRKMSKLIVVNDIYKLKRSFKLCQTFPVIVLPDLKRLIYNGIYASLEASKYVWVHFGRAIWRLFLIIFHYNCGLKTFSNHISLWLWFKNSFRSYFITIVCSLIIAPSALLFWLQDSF